MKIRKIIGFLLTLTMLLTGVVGSTIAVADDGDFEPNGIQIVNAATDYIAVPGETVHIKLPVCTSGGTLFKAFVEVVGDDNGMMSASEPYFTRDGEKENVDEIYDFGTTNVEFDVSAKANTKIGNYPITLKFRGYNYRTQLVTATLELTINMRVKEQKLPAQLNVTNVKFSDVAIGSRGDITLSVKNDGEIDIKEANVEVDYNESGIIPNYLTPKLSVGGVKAKEEKKISIPVRVLGTATEGIKKISFVLTYKDVENIPKEESIDYFVDMKVDDNQPKLEVIDTYFEGDLSAGNDVSLVVKVENVGNLRARDITIAIDPSSINSKSSFVKNYFTEAISYTSLKADGTMELKLPLTIAKQAEAGVKDLSFIITYKNDNEVKYDLSTIIYPEIKAAEGTKDGKPNLIISNVKQSLDAPEAGKNLTISFVAENKSDIDIKELKVSVANYSNSTFIPVSSEPYIYVNGIKGGEKTTVEIPVTLSKSIAKGLNNITVAYSYEDAAGNNSGENTINIPILNVQNDLSTSISKPKLIISNYTVDPLELRAGSVFNFTFEMTNTNANVTATNITIKVSQNENIFTPTQGGNSFYIDKISPNETVSRSLEMKIKSDAATRLYPMTLEIEYEYDGIEPNPQTGDIGEKATENLNIQVIENARPVVDYVNVYSWDGSIMLNSPATLSFEFYNMGKSQLNNVIATVEGDFSKSDGNMYFAGNIMSGYSEYIEFDVLPLVEGQAKGTLKITFEDSNGDEVSYTKEFETFVSGAMDFSGDYMGGDFVDTFMPTMPEAKKPILPTWVFIAILPVALLAGLFSTRAIMISAYKRKVRKMDEI